MSLRVHPSIRVLARCLQALPSWRARESLGRLIGPLIARYGLLFEIEPGIRIPAELDDAAVRWYFAHGLDRNLAFRLARALMEPACTVFDVGANVGIWILTSARNTGEFGSIYAFEPVPENYARLVRNLRMNGLGRVRCERLALSDRSGVGLFYASSNGNSGMGSLARREGVDRQISVNLLTLDEYCRRHSIRHVDFLKVDVEGGELDVLRGADGVLRSDNAPVVLLEVDDTLASSFLTSPSIVIGYLEAHGYRVFRYAGKRMIGVRSEDFGGRGDLFAFKAYHLEHYSARGLLPE